MNLRIMVVADTNGLQDFDLLGRHSGNVLIHCGDSLDEDAERWLAGQFFEVALGVGAYGWFTGAVNLRDQGFIHRGLLMYGAAPADPLEPMDVGTLRSRLDLIPDHPGVLITPGPPQGILDRHQGKSLGCPHLRERVEQVRPLVHCFGGAPESAGHRLVDGTLYVNACVLDEARRLRWSPTFVDLVRVDHGTWTVAHVDGP